MQNISFYPGPSKIYPQIAGFMQDACQCGILSVNHRSQAFVEVSKTTLELLRNKLHIPDSYSILYVGSATECWEIINQSLVEKKSYHIFNGSFGERAYFYAQKLSADPGLIISHLFDVESSLDIAGLSIPEDNEVIFVCQNETSNGTALQQTTLQQLRAKYPDQLIAVDATSSLAGIELDYHAADIWYASVQKCFGLPAGMALMIVSPKAQAKALALHKDRHYNSLVSLLEKIAEFQTTYTPNVLNIYLLMRVMEMVDDIQVIHQRTQERAATYYKTLEGLQHLKALAENPQVRSQTVISVKTSDQSQIARIKEDALREGLILGNGYGKWKDNTFRIANFPALEAEEIQKLIVFLQKEDTQLKA